MRERSDPLVVVLGSAVALVVVGAIGLVFYPRISRWFGPRESSVSVHVPSASSTVPVWVCRSVDGVALLLVGGFDRASADVLDRALTGGAHSYLRLSVYNFGRAEPFVLALGKGLASPDGGPEALPAAARLRPDLPERMRTVLLGMGAVDRLEVPKGHRGQALLMIDGDPAARSSFASGALMFERRNIERETLASWQSRPDLEQFMEF